MGRYRLFAVGEVLDVDLVSAWLIWQKEKTP